MPAPKIEEETIPNDTVVIAGGGPVGLVLALVLAHHGQRSIVLEQNVEATKYPKMHLVIAHTMETFRRLGLADELRSRGVPRDEPFTVRFSSGLGAERSLTAWDLPSAEEFEKRIREKNDGTMPSEPWARIPSYTMEPWLREVCERSELIEMRFGWAVQDVAEGVEGVDVTVQCEETGVSKRSSCAYLVGCDGARSQVRKSVGLELEGVPMHRAVALTHFKSRDLERLHRQGKFYHTFFPMDPTLHNGSVGGAIIAQDGKETWTVHDYLGSDYKEEDITPEKTISRVLGGMGEPYPIEIDEVAATSVWTPTVALAKQWISPHGRVFLAGDSCHQTIPTGGYGMNMGLADAWNLGWKLAATIQGWGGPQLLATYEAERRPIAALMQHWSKVHMGKLMGLSKTVKLDASIIDSHDESGKKLRHDIDQYIQANDDHNQSFGVEMGYRYDSDLSNVDDELDAKRPAPEFSHRDYAPTTCPGYRVPHVFLSDGSAISDHFGNAYTAVAFADGHGAESCSALASLEAAAKKTGTPLKTLSLSNEPYASELWGAKVVLVRPDGFAAWRTDSLDTIPDAEEILSKAAGHVTK